MAYPNNEPETSSKLREFIERYEALAAERRDIADQQKEVMAEAKAFGYDTKIIRLILNLRSRDVNDVAEESALVEIYKRELGME